ncbi:MAG: PTS IIA-like nitrogen regulatory protein PtsN [Rhodothalassiaceae bacterium]
MAMRDLLNPEAVRTGVKAGSKKQLLQIAARHAADLSGVSAEDLFAVLMERERLGSTGVGAGVAIPHAKLDGVDHIFGLFYQLAEPVPFEAVDDRPVDLMFMLLAPAQSGADHLKSLARVSRLLRDETMRQRLRGSQSADALFALLVQEQADAA